MRGKWNFLHHPRLTSGGEERNLLYHIFYSAKLCNLFTVLVKVYSSSWLQGHVLYHVLFNRTRKSENGHRKLSNHLGNLVACEPVSSEE